MERYHAFNLEYHNVENYTEWGATGRPIRHCRGLHQGDPLSAMLFILVMDPIQKMLDLATQEGLLTPIGRTSEYE